MTTFCRFLPRPGARHLLYCFPYAGGSAAAYRPWVDLVPATLEVRAVQLPPQRTGALFAGVVAQLASAVAIDAGQRPFVFFGHSMGGLLAFETARELRRRGQPLPQHLAISARPVPPNPGNLVLHGRSEPELLDAAAQLGGIPPEVASQPELVRLMLRLLRRDLALLDSYRYVAQDPLSCPFSLFGANADLLVSASDLIEWRRMTTGPVFTHLYAGGHFYLRFALVVVVRDLLVDLGLAVPASLRHAAERHGAAAYAG